MEKKSNPTQTQTSPVRPNPLPLLSLLPAAHPLLSQACSPAAPVIRTQTRKTGGSPTFLFFPARYPPQPSFQHRPSSFSLAQSISAAQPASFSFPSHWPFSPLRTRPSSSAPSASRDARPRPKLPRRQAQTCAARCPLTSLGPHVSDSHRAPLFSSATEPNTACISFPR